MARMLLPLLLALVRESTAVVTCKGFVKTSTSLTNDMDHSLIKMHLFTSSGLLKYSTECAPNGYYFIPVYDRGSFYLQIEGPTGWAFDPFRVPFEVNDEVQGCAEDIDFRFTGFSLLGAVEGSAGDDCAASNKGPEGVEVQLFGPEEAGGGLNKLLATVHSIKGGQFEVEDVSPGEYRVVASHPVWPMGLSEQTVTMEWGNSNLPQPFTLGGYQLKASIISSGEPVSGVNILLYSATSKDVTCEPPAQDEVFPEHPGVLLCATKSNEKGEILFSNLPCGEYVLVPIYTRTHTTFDVQPSELDVSLTHGDYVMQKAFQVMGFSIQGSVLNTAGNGVEGAEIFVNGEKRTTTDADGKYKLEQITTGSYNIKAQKTQMIFKDIVNYNLSPAIALLPEIVATKYEICGIVDSGATIGSHTVQLTGEGENLSTVTNAKGRYCFQVSPGSYSIAPVLKSSEKSKGIYLSPPARDVVITDTPNNNANFQQAVVSVSGRVNCLGPCSSQVRVSLGIKNKKSPTITQLDEEGGFRFENVYPGTYEVIVTHESWCFESQTNVFEIEYENIADLEFVQNGYALESEVSHDAAITIKYDGSEDEHVSLVRGRNRHCVSKPGIYTVIPVSCYRFDKEQYTFNTASPIVLVLQARDYRVHGQIQLKDEEKFGAILSLPVTVRMVSRSVNEEVEIQAKFLRIQQLEGKEGNMRVYEYEYWASPGDEFEIIPKISPSKDGPISSLLFYPRSIVINLDQEECPPPAPSIEGRPGLYYTGVVSPNVSGAEIVVESKKGGESLTVISGKDGSYQAGPLYDDDEYTVTARGDGYHFKKESPGNFVALKLGKIDINIAVQGEAGSTPLEGVLLSLSGDNQFSRSNEETDDTGSFVFNELFPGKYFLRPLLKEYRFEPASQTIELGQAGSVTEKFTAIRTAYSAYGSVKSLNGEAEKHLKVEATQMLESEFTADGARQYPRYEETETDANGDFRLKGLMPDSKYLVTVQSSKGRVDRSSPHSIMVSVGSEDTVDVNFVAFRRLNKFDLTGVVNTTQDALDSLTVVLASSSNPDKAIKTVDVTSDFPFYEFSSLPEDKYVVYAQSSLTTRTHTMEAPRVTVDLVDHVHIETEFTATLKSSNQDFSQGSLFSLLMFAVAGVLFLNREQVVELAPGLFEQAVAMTQPSAPIKAPHTRTSKKGKKKN